MNNHLERQLQNNNGLFSLVFYVPVNDPALPLALVLAPALALACDVVVVVRLSRRHNTVIEDVVNTVCHPGANVIKPFTNVIYEYL
jgi:hypothetical protein